MIVSSSEQSRKQLGQSERCNYMKHLLCSYIFLFFLMHINFSLQAKRKLDLEDPLYLPEFRTPKGKGSITARIPSPRSEYTTVDKRRDRCERGVVMQWVLWVDPRDANTTRIGVCADNISVALLVRFFLTVQKRRSNSKRDPYFMGSRRHTQNTETGK